MKNQNQVRRNNKSKTGAKQDGLFSLERVLCAQIDQMEETESAAFVETMERLVARAKSKHQAGVCCTVDFGLRKIEEMNPDDAHELELYLSRLLDAARARRLAKEPEKYIPMDSFVLEAEIFLHRKIKELTPQQARLMHLCLYRSAKLAEIQSGATCDQSRQLDEQQEAHIRRSN